MSVQITNRYTNIESLSLNKYLVDISKFTLLTETEEYDLITKAKAGDKKALNRVVESNLRFVVSVAKQFINKNVSLDDLINEGNIGLIKAVGEFDVTRGFKFISYAVWFIRQRISLYLEENTYLFRIPSGKVKATSTVNKAVEKLTIKNNRPPSRDELVDFIGDTLTTKTIDIVLRINRIKGTSLDTPMSDDSSSILLSDLIEGNDEPTSHLVEEDHTITNLRKLLSVLTPKERDIVKLTYGLFGEEKLTMEQVSDRLDITPARIQQISSGAIKKLQSLSKTVKFQRVLG